MPSVISAGTTAGTAIAISGDTTGNLAFQTNGTTTAMTINTSQNVQLNAAGARILNSSGNPILLQTGSVLQVVQSVLTSQVSSTATSYTNIGLSASITPTSASSRILAIANIGMVNTGGNAGSFLAIFRGSTILAQGDANGSRSRTMSGSMYADMTNSGLPMTMIYLDSPSTTSSTTYDIRGANLESSTAWFVNRSRANDNISYGFTSVSTLVLMEIAA